MTINEKIGRSSDKSMFTLFKEGLFYKCYNEDAMVFTQRVRVYKLSNKYVKKVKKEIVSIGFPVSVLANITSLAKEKSFEISQPDNEGVIRITTNGSFEGSFEEWKNSIKLQEPAQSNNNYISTHLDKRKEAVIEKLKGYSLANHTPVETMTLVMELQKELAVIKPE